MTFDRQAQGQIASRHEPLILDHLGPAVEVITDVNVSATAPGLMRGTIPHRGFVPMHSHADPETFYVLQGRLEALTYVSADIPQWVPITTGQVFHVPPNARHALRNVADEPSVALIISTPDMVAFFEQTGRPLKSVDAQRPAPTAEYIERLLSIAQEHGHWLAPPELNAEVGLQLTGLPGA